MVDHDISAWRSWPGGIRIRDAAVSDVQAMNQLAQRAKAYWGYAQSDLERWAAELRVCHDTVGAWPTFVAESDSVLLGWVQIDPTRSPWALEALWVDPAHMGQGVGRRLLRLALAVGAASGQEILSIDADPHAAGFYRKCGARQVGIVAAPVIGEPNRVRPQLEIGTAAWIASRFAP